MAKKRAGRYHRTRCKPLTLAALEEFGALARFAPPDGDFDPQGKWTHKYRLWLVSSGGLAPKPADKHYRGFLQIRRGLSADGNQITLHVRQSILQQTPGVHDTAAVIECAADALASPRSWKLKHTVRDGRMKPVPKVRVDQKGEIRNGSVQVDYGNRTTNRRVPPLLTSDWSLLDAVQRLRRRESPPLEFAMLAQLDLLKRSQRIAYCGVDEYRLGGHSLRLHCYQHVGNGILPYKYYVDQQGRLLVAVGGLTAYIFDPTVPELHEKCLALIAKRTKR